MARMIPERPAESTQSKAELRLFEHLRAETADELTVFHHVSWLLPGKKGRARQGEADFVLAHPQRGLLVLEVKGGTIAYDAGAGAWSSTGQNGTNPIRDPFGQAERSAFSLRDLLERSRRVDDSRYFVHHAVAFPDTRMKSARLKPDAPREIIIDGDDARSIDQSLERVSSFWHGKAETVPLGQSDLAHVERVLANSFEVHAPLAVELAEEERELLRLTEEQYRYLDLLNRQTRVAIMGCAGSGKTFLAAEKARRLAAQGFRVLVVCFNRFLAEHLRRGLEDIEEIDVYSYDGLALSVVREADPEFPAEPPSDGDQGSYWNSLRRAFADSVLEAAAGRYGALIIDEAQDFHPDWWTPLQLMLDDPDESPLYVFLDDNQRIFAVPENLPVPGEPMQLTVNCRNTKTINRLVNSFYRGATIEADGPEGIPIEKHFYATDKELLALLDATVEQWLERGGVQPEDIALLTPKAAHRSALWTVEQLGGARLTDDPWETGRILRSSIHKFKGLERLVVGVAELDGARDDVFYVGFSRPNLFLSIFCPEDARKRLPRELLS